MGVPLPQVIIYHGRGRGRIIYYRGSIEGAENFAEKVSFIASLLPETEYITLSFEAHPKHVQRVLKVLEARNVRLIHKGTKIKVFGMNGKTSVWEMLEK